MTEPNQVPYPVGEPAIRITAMPADANPAGDIFGGWLMAQVDTAAGIIAARYSQDRAATVAVEGMKFHHPVHVGDKVSVYATLTSVGWTSNESSEEGDGSTGGVGTKSTVEVGDSTKVALKTKIITEFQSSLKTNVETIFKHIQQQVDNDNDNHSTSHENAVTWKVGIDPAKEKKAGEDEKKKDDGGGGILDTLGKIVSSGAKWVYNKGKGLVKKIPIIKDVLSVAGDIWDGISGRGRIERDSTTTDGHTDGDTHNHTHTDGTEITSLTSIATELSRKMIVETATEVERAVSTKVGLEVTTNAEVNKSRKKAGNHGASGTVVTHEVGKPQVLIKKIK